jgi:hypothetical protein
MLSEGDAHEVRLEDPEEGGAHRRGEAAPVPGCHGGRREAAAERRCGPLGGRRRALSCPTQFVSAAFFAVSAPALAASARTPAPISFTSILTWRILPLNLLSYAL